MPESATIQASRSSGRHGRVEIGANTTIEAVDVPGAYSLSARSAEEQIAINSVLGIAGYPEPALVVLVVDSGQLIRNLYLALQLAELGAPFVIALNMIDEVTEAPPSAEAVGALFGVPLREHGRTPKDWYRRTQVGDRQRAEHAANA